MLTSENSARIRETSVAPSDGGSSKRCETETFSISQDFTERSSSSEFRKPDTQSSIDHFEFGEGDETAARAERNPGPRRLFRVHKRPCLQQEKVANRKTPDGKLSRDAAANFLNLLPRRVRRVDMRRQGRRCHD